MPQREYYVDRLRSVMVALVILHHTAITYGAIGGWFWREVEPSSSPSGVLLMLFCTTNQAYFMGLFFLLAGYFTPASLERKGFTRFIGDRFLRLGVLLLAFILILGPLTAGIGNFAQADGFWPAIRWIWQHKEIINGPLMISLCCQIQRMAGQKPSACAKFPIPAVSGPRIRMNASNSTPSRKNRSPMKRVKP